MGLEGIGESSNNVAEVSLCLLPQSLDGVHDSSLLGLLGGEGLKFVHTSVEDVLKLGLDEGGHLEESAASLLLELLYKPSWTSQTGR